MSTRLHIVVSEELVARIDAVKGPGQPRADWIRRAVEQALGDQSRCEPPPSAPAEQPEELANMNASLSRADAFRRATQKR